MVTLERNTLVFSFPELHPAAVCRVSFQRTLRIPDDNPSYPLPPGLGTFPLKPVTPKNVLPLGPGAGLPVSDGDW